MKSPIEEKMAAHLEPMLAALGWVLRRGVRVGKYTPDFIVQYDADRFCIVECDGHTYHDRTDEQATHDRKRDRWFLRVMNAPTIRFSSTEIFKNAEACATELIRTVAAIRDGHVDAMFQGWLGAKSEAHP